MNCQKLATASLFRILPGLFVCLSVSTMRAEEPVDYAHLIKPTFTTRCVACHGVLRQEGGLRLDTAALAIRGGDSGAAIAPGDAASSLLLKRITAQANPRTLERVPAGARFHFRMVIDILCNEDRELIF